MSCVFRRVGRLDVVETNTERVILLSSLGDVATENTRRMFYALTMLLQGPPLQLLKKRERRNGFEAWRLLVERSRLHHVLPEGVSARLWRLRSLP